MNRCVAPRHEPGYQAAPVLFAPSPKDLGEEKAASGFSYTAQALATTAKAFTLPTIVAPLLFPMRFYCVRFIATGLILADQLVKGRAVRFTPPVDSRQSLYATSLGLFPFIPGFALHARLGETCFSNPQTRAFKFAEAIAKSWSGLSSRLPEAVARIVRRYPLHLVLGLSATQLTASAAGSGVSASYHRARGAKLVQVKHKGPAKNLPERVKENAAAYVAGASLFTLPAALASPPVQKAIKGAGLSGAAASAVIATGVVIAAGALSLNVMELQSSLQ
jgi:hypothetical protein